MKTIISEPIYFDHDRNDITFVEIRTEDGALIERRVTVYSGQPVEDVHFSSSYAYSKRKNKPNKYTTNTRIKSWGA